MGTDLMQYGASGTAVSAVGLDSVAHTGDGASCMPGPMASGFLIARTGCSLRPDELATCRAARHTLGPGLRHPLYQRRTDAGWASGRGVAPSHQLPTQTRRPPCR